jgi:hypothetical protein
MKIRGWVLGAAIGMLALPAGASQRLSIKVSPAVAFAPANLIVRAMVEADRDNRSIEIVAESGDFYRSSEVELDGDDAPRVKSFEFRSLPEGTYRVRATLHGPGGQERAMAETHVDIIDSGSER